MIIHKILGYIMLFEIAILILSVIAILIGRLICWARQAKPRKRFFDLDNWYPEDNYLAKGWVILMIVGFLCGLVFAFAHMHGLDVITA